MAIVKVVIREESSIFAWAWPHAEPGPGLSDYTRTTPGAGALSWGAASASSATVEVVPGSGTDGRSQEGDWPDRRGRRPRPSAFAGVLGGRRE